MSDTGSDSSFEARQPQALFDGASQTIDASSPSANPSEINNQTNNALGAQTDITGQVVDESDFKLGLVAHASMDDCKCGRDRLL